MSVVSPFFQQEALVKFAYLYKGQIDKAIKESIVTLGPKGELRDACEYALTNGGKRFRPAIVLCIAEALQKQFSAAPAALAVEFFHTASLIADDLPCMDNEEFRREKKTVHCVFNESTALLATYALIASGYEQIHKNGQLLKGVVHNPDEIAMLALENATFNTGLMGATGGQFLDLFLEDLNEQSLRTILHQKTVSLFEISFVFGWLFGGGDIQLLPKLKQCASHFGMAFQIADDLADLAQDQKKERAVNFALTLGESRAKEVLKEEIEQLASLLHELKIYSEEMGLLVSFLKGCC